MAFEAIVADVETGLFRLSIFDFSEEGTVNNLISGAVEQDGAILVVSAADGPMPQAREQLRLARQVGVQAMVVFLDLDNAESAVQIEQAEAQIREALCDAGYDGKSVAVIKGSATGVLRGDSRALPALADLADALDAAIIGQ